jgi:hypothetical protein
VAGGFAGLHGLRQWYLKRHAVRFTRKRCITTPER